MKYNLGKYIYLPVFNLNFWPKNIYFVSVLSNPILKLLKIWEDNFLGASHANVSIRRFTFAKVNETNTFQSEASLVVLYFTLRRAHKFEVVGENSKSKQLKFVFSLKFYPTLILVISTGYF